MSPELPWLREHSRLAERFPPLAIGCWPTPVTEARCFAAAHGLRALYVKREDLSHPVCGGNKTRGLEFILAEARRREARSILTLGAAGSHHVAATGWHARQMGIETVALVTPQPAHEYVRRNLTLGLAAGVTYIPVNLATLMPALLARRWLPPRGARRARPYYIPAGGTTPRACLGHVNAALELKQQIDAGLFPEPDYLYVALGSLGTAAGLALGCRLAGLRTQLVGVVVSYRWYCTPRRWARLARRTLARMRHADPTVPDIAIEAAELEVVASALGPGYACVTDESWQLAQELRTGDGLDLDGTYTAKLLHGMVQFVEQRRLHDRVHLFWHSFHEPPVAAATAGDVAKLPRALQRYFADTAMRRPSPATAPH